MDKRDKKLLASIINYLDPRFTKIESEISSLKLDVSSLKSDVSSLKSDVLTINKYISTESKIKEINANNLIEDFFNKNNIYYNKLNWKNVYDRKGKEITEFMDKRFGVYNNSKENKGWHNVSIIYDDDKEEDYAM